MSFRIAPHCHMDIALHILEWVGGLGAIGWFFWLRLHRREGTLGGLIAKFLASAVLLWIVFGVIVP
ncbi:MAG: hypothetical protein EB082_10015, partial [Verrucomicrobia bacterium]|nr:hypothetical protein [Verrucomicrobiota bacterium]